MKPHIRRFAVTYLGLTMAAALIAVVLQTGAGFGLNLAATMGASMLAAQQFFREQRRAPTTAEARIFGWQGLLAVWAVSLMLGSLAILYLFSLTDTVEMVAGMLRPAMLFFALLGAAALSGIYYLAIRWPYQWFGRLLERRAPALRQG